MKLPTSMAHSRFFWWRQVRWVDTLTLQHTGTTACHKVHVPYIPCRVVQLVSSLNPMACVMWTWSPQPPVYPPTYRYHRLPHFFLFLQLISYTNPMTCVLWTTLSCGILWKERVGHESALLRAYDKKHVFEIKYLTKLHTLVYWLKDTYKQLASDWHPRTHEQRYWHINRLYGFWHEGVQTTLTHKRLRHRSKAKKNTSSHKVSHSTMTTIFLFE